MMKNAAIEHSLLGDEDRNGASLFPLFMKLEGCRCLVVGAGAVADSKIEGLLTCGARVHVVAPSLTETIAGWARSGRVTCEQRAFRPADLEGMRLVVAATSSEAVNERVFRHADARQVLCNAVDEPERCHFYYGAVVRRGALQIAISTGGLSPALASRMRGELESQFGPEYKAWLEWLGWVRQMLFSLKIQPAERKRLLQRLTSRKVFEWYCNRQEFRREVPA